MNNGGESRQCGWTPGSGSDQGGLVGHCQWDWLPVIVNLSLFSVVCPFLCAYRGVSLKCERSTSNIVCVLY